MKNTIYLSIFCILLLLILSCSDQNPKQFSLNNFNIIKLTKFNKNIVQIETSFNFLNDSEKDLVITNSDFDIFINGLDITSHINMSPTKVEAHKNYQIPIKVKFEPSKAFADYKSGIVKIKSDIVATVKITGIIQAEIDAEVKIFNFSDEQVVLFTNNKKLKLNNEGEIIQKD